MNIPQPKRGELQPWMIWVMSLAVVALFSYLIYQDRSYRKEILEKEHALQKCQEERTAAEAGFREEIKQLYQEVQAFREEIYRAATRQNKKRR